MLVSGTTTLEYRGAPFSIVTITIEKDDSPDDFNAWFKEWRGTPGVARKFRIDVNLWDRRPTVYNVVISSDFEFGAFMTGWTLRGMFEHPGK
jgi:hypothetical protein